jgi:hypothetical protein
VQDAILALPDNAWAPAIDADGQPRDGDVAELTGMLPDLAIAGWPDGMLVIVRRERPHPGAQLTFTDIDGWRFQAMATDTRAGSGATGTGRPDKSQTPHPIPRENDTAQDHDHRDTRTTERPGLGPLEVREGDHPLQIAMPGRSHRSVTVVNSILVKRTSLRLVAIATILCTHAGLSTEKQCGCPPEQRRTRKCLQHNGPVGGTVETNPAD